MRGTWLRTAIVAVGAATSPLLVSAAARAASSSTYVVNEAADTVSQFTVGPGGLLSLKSPATAVTGATPDFIAITPDGKSAYVSNLDGTVSQYDVGVSGLLSPKTQPTATVGGNPRALAVSPEGKSVYVVNFFGSVAQFTVGAGGELSPKSPASVLTSEPTSVAVSRRRCRLVCPREPVTRSPRACRRRGRPGRRAGRCRRA